jgi:DNA-binding NarL/FixJ family response regulator
LTTSEARLKAKQDPDFINLKRFDYSIEKLLERYPEGAPNKLIAQGLMLSEDEVDTIFNNIILKLRHSIGVTDL